MVEFLFANRKREMRMTRDDAICIAEDFSEWLEDMAEKYNLDKDDVQDLIKQFLI